MHIDKQQLDKKKKAELQVICVNYGINKSGNKQELVERIIAHQEKNQRIQNVVENRFAYGNAPALLPNGEPDTEFEQVMTSYLDWSQRTNWSISKMSETSLHFHKIDIREIRASFKDYLNNGTTKSRMYAFLEMFFDLLDGEWIMMHEQDTEEIFDDDEQRAFMEYRK